MFNRPCEWKQKGWNPHCLHVIKLIFSLLASGAMSGPHYTISLDVGLDTTHNAVWKACNLEWRRLDGKSCSRQMNLVLICRSVSTTGKCALLGTLHFTSPYQAGIDHFICDTQGKGSSECVCVCVVWFNHNHVLNLCTQAFWLSA